LRGSLEALQLEAPVRMEARAKRLDEAARATAGSRAHRLRMGLGMGFRMGKLLSTFDL
jgi:hypothetical protein